MVGGPPRWLPVLKWFATTVMLLGVLTLALNAPWSGWGWVVYLVGSSSWVAAGTIMREPSIVVVNVGAIVIQSVGIWRWLIGV